MKSDSKSKKNKPIKVENLPAKMELKITPDYTKYVNVNRWYSYDGIHHFIVIGGRGIGKTTGLMIHSIMDYMNLGGEFMYLRRYITELRKSKSLPNRIVTGTKTEGLGAGLVQWTNNKKRIGYGAALSAHLSFKSGTDFDNVNTLIFDEAILPKGSNYRYLPNEIYSFLELLSTVFRTRKNYKVFIVGNNADMFNPYFAYFGVPKFTGNYINRERDLYCELCKNSPALLEDEMQTPLYKLTHGTSYAEYHYNNEVLIDTEGKIGVKTPQDRLVCRFVYNGYTLNLYRRRWNEWFMEMKDKVIKDDKTYLIMENNKPNYLYIDQLRRDDISKVLNICYYNKYLYFESPECSVIFDLVMEVL